MRFWVAFFALSSLSVDGDLYVCIFKVYISWYGSITSGNMVIPLSSHQHTVSILIFMVSGMLSIHIKPYIFGQLQNNISAQPYLKHWTILITFGKKKMWLGILFKKYAKVCVWLSEWGRWVWAGDTGREEGTGGRKETDKKFYRYQGNSKSRYFLVFNDGSFIIDGFEIMRQSHMEQDIKCAISDSTTVISLWKNIFLQVKCFNK